MKALNLMRHPVMAATLIAGLLLAACVPAATPTPAPPPKPPEAAKPVENPAVKPADTSKPAEPAKPADAAKPAEPPAKVFPAVKKIDLKPGEKVKVGFLYVGPRDDFGYNYAADQGRLAMEKKLPFVETVFAENVPENAEAERVMEQMIRGGAKIIFPTSYGHFDPAVRIAEKYPDVTFLHQGGPKATQNVGSYFGDIYEPVYAAGVAAGKTTKTNKLGYIVAHPIPQTLLNVSAFELGAKSVNPAATTTVVFTADWCNPAKNTEAANSLISQGIDVLTQHQDCPGPVIQAAERGGVWSVGYHADARPIAKTKWITAAIWTWGDTYSKLVQDVVDGKYQSTVSRTGPKDGVVALAPFGENVSEDAKKASTDVMDKIIKNNFNVFTGPVKDQSGAIKIPDGKKPTTAELEATAFLVEGVIGTLPK